MTSTPTRGGSRLAAESLIPAHLESVRRCPARSDYVELCFETDEGPWTWCVADLAATNECGSSDGVLAITVGPYGARARQVEDGGRLGFALPSSEAMPMILAGARTYLVRKLVERK